MKKLKNNYLKKNSNKVNKIIKIYTSKNTEYLNIHLDSIEIFYFILFYLMLKIVQVIFLEY